MNNSVIEKEHSGQPSDTDQVVQTLEKIARLKQTPDLVSYLEIFAPERIGLIERILKQAGYELFGGKVLIDMAMPANVGGRYLSAEKEMDCVVYLNPILLLSGTEEEIAHVLVHEGVHAGIYTGGEEVSDESIVETLAKKGMEEMFGGTTMRTGYDQMVYELAPFLADLSFTEIVQRIENGNVQTFNNFLELIVLKPLISSSPFKLDYRSIQTELSDKWEMLRRLFPRILNEIDGNNAGVHEAATIESKEYKLEGLLDKAADIIKERGDLPNVIRSLFENNPQINNLNDALIKLREAGYQYLFDSFPREIMEMIGGMLSKES